MKKNVKKLLMVCAVGAVSAFALLGASCNNSIVDWFEQKIEQIKCEHEWNDVEVTKESTCMEKGELTKTCTLCEKVETEELELVDHVAVYMPAVTPTCTEKGLTDGTVCSVCETKISGFQEVPALGHIVVKDSAVKATCLESGLEAGEHCSRCDEVFVQQAIVPATGHSIVEFAGVPATCTTVGVTNGAKCELCDKVYSGCEELSVLPHTYEGLICTICGAVNVSAFLDAVPEGYEVATSFTANDSCVIKATDYNFDSPTIVVFDGAKVVISNGVELLRDYVFDFIHIRINKSELIFRLDMVKGETDIITFDLSGSLSYIYDEANGLYVFELPQIIEGSFIGNDGVEYYLTIEGFYNNDFKSDVVTIYKKV